MSRLSSSWKASRRTRRSRRSSTRPKYPRRDSLHPAGAVAWRGARAGRSRRPVAPVGTRGDAPRGPGPGGGRVARRPPRATGGAASAPSGRPSGGAAGVFRGPPGRSDLSLAERRAPGRSVAAARGASRPARRRAAAEMDRRSRARRSTRDGARQPSAPRSSARGRIRPRLGRAAGPGVAARANRAPVGGRGLPAARYGAAPGLAGEGAASPGAGDYPAAPRGRLAVKRVLDVLARVEPRLVEPDYPGAFRYLAARNRKRALTVLFTDVIDRFASDALVANVASLRPRHLPLAVTLQNPELNQVAALRPVAAHDAFRKAAAEELLRAREEALGRMRRAGVLVLDVPPARAAEAVVAKYLDLKRRGRL